MMMKSSLLDPGRRAAAGAAPESGVGPRTGDAAAADTAVRALRVLVVEDLPRVQVLLRELIDEPGRFEIAGMAETEHDAIEQYHALQPDALVIDLNLRQGTGLGVIMAVRRTPAARRPLLLVLTNHALPVLEAACLSAGADHFLDKSRDFHKVRPLLEQARSQGAPGTSH
jgi:two-component system, OmpR family, response regulator